MSGYEWENARVITMGQLRHLVCSVVQPNGDVDLVIWPEAASKIPEIAAEADIWRRCNRMDQAEAIVIRLTLPRGPMPLLEAIQSAYGHLEAQAEAKAQEDAPNGGPDRRDR